MAKKSKTNASNTSHTVVTPTTPDWLSNMTQSLNLGIQKVGGASPYDYVAPVSALENQAAKGAANLGGQRGADANTAGSDAWFSKLLNGPAPSVTSASLLDNLSSYYSPFRKEVTDSAMADFDADAGRTRASQDLAIAGQGAFGGSGAALTKSLTEGELARARSTKLSQLLSEMFTVGAGLSGQDADRRQQASAASAQIAAQDNQMKLQAANDRAASDRADIATQASVGAQLRGADQAMRQAPISTLNSQIEMFSGLPLSLFSGQTTDSQGTSSSTTRETGASLGEIASLISSISGFPGLGGKGAK
ncbi:hypothetical protein [Phenylobacterium sp.]|uniref:hypothetical protein n=1 Tax=Phenylobacterium sp. TaxID=1871053 RepID=UPI002722FA82|nr:hypothetical protein [Phenylobacterium sp.]MDO8380521.1 hypothetical protein [Phenylobacterium sp.]